MWLLDVGTWKFSLSFKVEHMGIDGYDWVGDCLVVWFNSFVLFVYSVYIVYFNFHVDDGQCSHVCKLDYYIVCNLYVSDSALLGN